MKKKKVKKYAEGGLAGLAESAESLIGDVDNMANTINYGTTSPKLGGSSDSVGFGSVVGMKKGGSVKMAKGGSVKSSASKRADGIAMRGKTRGRMV